MDKLENTKNKKEARPDDTQSGGISRRKFLILAGGTGAAAAVLAACNSTPLTSTITSTITKSPSTTTTTVTTTPTPTAAVDTYMFFSQSNAATVQAICSRIIPSASGDPGAVEAKAYIYIDHALAGTYISQQNTYRRGLAAMDAYSQTKFQKNFADLAAAQQDTVLTDMQTGAATGFYGPDSTTFFNTLVQHVKEGTFSDPLYGGNQGSVGWKMEGFPGAQVAYGDTDMAIGADQSKKTILTLADEESIIMPMPTNGF